MQAAKDFLYENFLVCDPKDARFFSMTTYHWILYSNVKCTTKVCEAEMTMTRCGFVGLLIHNGNKRIHLQVHLNDQIRIPWQDNEAIENTQCLVFVSLLHSLNCMSNRGHCVSSSSLWKHDLHYEHRNARSVMAHMLQHVKISSSEFTCPHCSCIVNQLSFLRLSTTNSATTASYAPLRTWRTETAYNSGDKTMWDIKVVLEKLVTWNVKLFIVCSAPTHTIDPILHIPAPGQASSTCTNNRL